ncbi:2-succinyl-6-hydroxy-2,4-cyclohexadiene-1-carboxylate synthase [Histophilus somni]|nr:2-succinyl-6-hydroxy-2,4-cyclohexadiene-1-carboxylate synthase [Histophilus somni]ARU67068.1 2-succinyl-6-hydroxy-2,4-cyclohexadiene-1-carboxylate synthase [Histophilus somni]ARU68945.1 2-succinyl-6-hydroxy-2,4-cyclohexadiene-1-carboxylate synthase [Histophilus somni]ARU70824.1 2-succinyl-6-hydroxy-2,4-cyclohexadiene-1-carboxylate synthase [Histophilus somni]ARU72696.1 2-succinyl-6-hydroxy-2,4-cyclohexadiene-1-carboxylate synthase [Histophilus somni]
MMPILVFLHGLLGTKQDWQYIIEELKKNLPHFSSQSYLCLDLPFHGEQTNYHIEDFEQSAQYLSRQITAKIADKPYILVGYSLGGRLALNYALQSKYPQSKLVALILEGANLGVENEQQRLERWQNDLAWAKRFSQETMSKVLNDWYQQPVFAHLSARERKQLISQRRHQSGQNIAKMLIATSLAKQPSFHQKVRSFSLPIYYFCGEKDEKFKQMAQENQLNLFLIERAGHNAHLENPIAFANKIVEIINRT